MGTISDFIENNPGGISKDVHARLPEPPARTGMRSLIPSLLPRVVKVAQICAFARSKGYSESDIVKLQDYLLGGELVEVSLDDLYGKEGS